MARAEEEWWSGSTDSMRWTADDDQRVAALNGYDLHLPLPSQGEMAELLDQPPEPEPPERRFVTDGQLRVVGFLLALVILVWVVAVGGLWLLVGGQLR